MYEFTNNKRNFFSSSFFFLLSFFFSPCSAQFTDDFADGDFINNPTWSGDTTNFIDTLGMLRSNDTVASAKFYLSTGSAIAANAQWEWWDSLQFNPSSANYIDVYLISDSANLKATSFNGYFVRIGNTSDEISLYKRSGATTTEIIDGIDGLLNTSNNVMRIKVTRDAGNLWTLQRDSTGTGNNFITEGTATDATFTTGSFFGLAIQQSTSSFFNKHWFDNFYAGGITGDTTGPALLQLTIISSTQLDLKFSEPISQSTAENELNYSANNGIGNPSSAIRDPIDSSIVHLTFSTAFANGLTNTITISNLQDSGGNIMTSQNQNFTYFVAAQAIFKDVVITEIFADPSPQIGLPNAEFIEIFNKSAKTFDLGGWKFSDGTSTATLNNYVLFPDSFLILCPTANVAEYAVFGTTMGLASFPSLNNTGDNLTFSDSGNIKVDAINYSDTWYQDAIKDDGGWSLELINPNNPCSGADNWIASVNSSGGTPGKINSVNDTTPDSLAPSLVSVYIISPTQIEVTFSEIMDSTSIANGMYSIDNGLSVVSVAVEQGNFLLVTLTLTPQIDTSVVYALSVSNVSDCSGNLIGTNDSLQFVIGFQPAAGEVIINEIFADPTPPVGLPNAEFVELFNKTNKLIDLSNSDFSGTTFPAGTSIQPNGYLILCYDTNAPYLAAYGSVAAMSGWSTSFLTNSGKDLILNRSGQQIDRVFYDLSWYQNTLKDDGGWSLELINPNNPCSGANNWSASLDSSGGTPGKTNSVNDTTPDSQAPSLVSVNIVSPTQIEVSFSESMDSASIANGTYIIDNGLSIVSVTIEAGNFSLVTLVLTPQIDTAVIYILGVSNVSDCSGNLIGANDSLQFIIGYQPSAGDIIINEIFADPTPVVGLPDGEYVELFNRSNKFLDLSNCNFSGATFSSGTAVPPNGYLILSGSSGANLFTVYGSVASMGSWSSTFLTNSGKDLILSLGNNIIDRVFYDISWYKDFTKDDGGWSLERINPIHPCSSADNWIASVDPTGGTPGKINSVYSISPDVQAPSVLSVIATSQNQVLITFSEGMDSASLVTNYTLNNGISVINVQPLSPDFTSVLLDVSPALDSATVYTGNIFSASDCSGNSISNSPFTFGIGVMAGLYDVLINEIYPDPDGAISSLPEVEFIELYNNTSKVINLNNYKLSDGSAVSTLSDAVIMPDSYLILCPSTNKSEYVIYGNAIGLSTFPSLNNAGDPLTLKDASGNLIHEVNYTDDWYGDELKKAGGWTLELIDPENPCGEGNNWRASNDASGGTPGKINSVNGTNSDTFPPEIISAFALDSFSVTLIFDETIDSASAINAIYSVNNGITVITIIIIDRKTVLITFANALQPNVIYTITASGISDCVGNSASNISAEFALVEQGEAGDILINEIYPDPDSTITSLPEVEFVELYNKTLKAINLNNYKFSDGSAVTTLANFVIMPNSYLILCPATNAGKYSTYGNTMGLSSFPDLNNSGDNLTLKDSTGNLIHEVNYTDDWYGDEVKKAGGWTLEMIDPENPCGEGNNWRASNDASGGTPGKINSVKGTNPDIFPPKILSAFALNPLSVILYFDETMDSISAKNANYSINNGINVFAILVIDKKTVQVNLANALQTKVLYTITASGMSDCVGNPASNTSAEFALAEQGEAGDIIINEILFNPRTNGSDFVEIYNNSDKVINLEGWELANIDNDSISNKKVISYMPLVLFPKDYLVLTKDTANIRKEYPLGKPDRYRQMGTLPNYNIDSGTVILINNLSNTSDEFSYYADMHFALLNDDKGVSLERIDFNRSSSDATNWHSASEAVGWATPGYQNSQYNPSEGDGSIVSIEPEIFSPDNDGFNDVVNINYKFDSPGFTATVVIYDAKGRHIRNLAKNSLLGIEGTFSWDGISDSREKARIGIYLIWFEAFDLNGKVLHFKRTCVLAGKMD